MLSISPSAASKPRGVPARNKVQPLLGSRRLSELVGFLLGVTGLLILLSLLSYQSLDPSFNTSPRTGHPHNWIGLWGSYTADAFFQVLGWAAYLVPLVLFVIGIRLLLVRPFGAAKTKLVGAVLLISSVTCLLELFPRTPPIGGLVRGSGILGYILGLELVRVFNWMGATIVAATVFLTSLFLVTRFSFSSAGLFLKTHFSFAKRIAVRWRAWREARERARLRKQLEKEKLTGKQPVAQRVSSQGVVSAPVQPKAAKTAPAAAPAVVAREPSEEKREKADAAEPERVPPVRHVPPPKVVRNRGLDLEVVTDEEAPPRIEPGEPRSYKLPSPTLLRVPEYQEGIDEDSLKERATALTDKFAEFGVMGAVTQIHPGPVVTTFEFKPEAGIKYSRIVNLVDDLCLGMKAESILIERVAGKSTVGIEVPNLHREIIQLRELIESSEFIGTPNKLTLSLGKDITGRIKVAELTSMPHLLIAGSTGSGKSVALNSFIISILYKATPNEVKFIMIDPKRLELNLYDGIPHLFTPIVTEPKVAANVLRRATLEMEERLKRLAQHGVRNIEQYNKLFEPDSTLNLFDADGQKQEGPLPYLVIVIDELADLMMVEPQTVEESITRLAQMARAVGIHLILATQRPSVDVITGLIKANLPSRISFRVASKVDSRTILDANGAEALLGRGDMLFMPPASSRLVRLHGPLITEKEINKVVDWWKAQSAPEYNEEFLKPFGDRVADDADDEGSGSADADEFYEEAVRLVVESGKASTSLLQRRLRLGYGRAARLLDLMEKDGIISSPDGPRPREVLKRPDWLQEVDESLR
jgi:S-DNA-T family DNA segregation ATPase FtsK/SpoIIIE